MWSYDATADAPTLVDRLLRAAREARATDVHLQPTADGLKVSWRVDGWLDELAVVPAESGLRMTTRLKVLAELLTYRVDLPQEGRIRRTDEGEVRVSTFPTVFGERVALRLFDVASSLLQLDDLGFDDETEASLREATELTSGAVLVTGPSGSGKTTTAYACLREIAAATPTRTVVTVEDPVESVLAGVAQSQLDESAGFDYGVALKALLRQDPQVILVGEIRDATVARTVVEAALTGHLVLSTFHAGSTAAALRRLLDMGIEPYHLRSSLRLVVNQHLVRTLCPCAERSADSGRAEPIGCDRCRRSGFRGRVPVCERLDPNRPEVAEAVLTSADVGEIEAAAKAAGTRSRLDSAVALVDSGRTTMTEVRRTFGLQPDFGTVD